LRDLRGNCGETPFQRGLPYLDEDEEGLFVPGFRIAPDSDEAFSELKIRTCPVADSNKCASIVEAYHRHKSGFFDLSKTFPTPSLAVLEAFDILELHYKLLENRLHQRRIEEIKNG